MNVSDDALWIDFCNGDQMALGTLFLRFRKILKQKSYSILNNVELANDCISEIFEYLLYTSAEKKQKLSQYNVRAFLFAKIKHISIQAYRHRATYRMFLEEYKWYFIAEYGECDALQTCIDTEAILSCISGRERDSIELSLYGYRIHEVAKMMKVSCNTAKTHIVRAKKKLRKINNF